MAFNISYVYRAIDAFSPVADKIARSVDNIKAKVDRSRQSMKEFGESMRNTGKSMTGFLTLPIAGLGIMALRSTAQLESMQISFESLLGSADKAKNMMADLKQFAIATPFELMDIAGASKQLLVAGTQTKDLTKTLGFLGDIASGAKVPLQDLAAIYAKSQNKGKAMAEELNQMSERGIPIMEALAKGTGRSKLDIYKAAEKGAVTFALVEKAMISMTKEGGIFYKQQERQSKTLSGIYSNMQDAITFSLGSIGDNLVETFALKDTMNSFISSLNSLTASFNAWIKQHPMLAKMVFIFIAFIAVLGPLLLILGALSLSFGVIAAGASVFMGIISFLATSVTFITGLFALWNAVVLVSPLGWLLTGILLVVAGVVYFRKEISELITKFKEWFTLKMPDWVKGLLKMQTGGMFGGTVTQNSMSEVINTNKSRAKVDVAISLEQLKGFNATTKSNITGNGGGNLGTNMVGAF